MKAQLFLLLPEYKDTGKNHTHFFLETTDLKDSKAYTKFISRLMATVLYTGEENAIVLYDPQNVAAFLYPIKTLPDLYPGRLLHQITLIEKRMQNWKRKTEQESTDVFRYVGKKTEKNTFCEIAKRLYCNQMKDEVFVVMNHEAVNTVTRRRERVHMECNGKNKSFVVISADVQNVLVWLKEKGIVKREYAPNTRKHGVGGVGGAGGKASKLLCSHQDAKKMMKKAFKFGRHLYYFDNEQKKYIKFMSGIDDKFHPYHITSHRDEMKNVKEPVKKVLRLHLGKIEAEY